MRFRFSRWRFDSARGHERISGGWQSAIHRLFVALRATFLFLQTSSDTPDGVALLPVAVLSGLSSANLS